MGATGTYGTWEPDAEAEEAAEEATFATALPDDCDADAEWDPEDAEDGADEADPECDPEADEGATVYVEAPMTVVLPVAASVTSGPPETDTTVALLVPADGKRNEYTQRAIRHF